MYDMGKAVEFINETLVPFMKGKDLANMGDFDEKLLTFCKEKHMVEGTYPAIQEYNQRGVLCCP